MENANHWKTEHMTRNRSQTLYFAAPAGMHNELFVAGNETCGMVRLPIAFDVLSVRVPHFSGADRRDGEPIVVGEPLRHD